MQETRVMHCYYAECLL